MQRRLLMLTLASAMSGMCRMAAAVPMPGAGELWFDPTQLPSFTGTVDRYLLNPVGETDGLLFREGPQVVFPPDMADAVREAAPVGHSLIVWGIRARTAPVITMLAFAPDSDTSPTLVERLYLRAPGHAPQGPMAVLAASGRVRQPYYSPQGETVGAILENGTVVLLPRHHAKGLDALLRPGARLAAEGPGTEAGKARALLATRIGPAPDALAPAAAADPPADR